MAYFINLAGGNIDYQEGSTPRFDTFSIIYCSFIIAALLFPLAIKKDVSFLIKVNSFGVYFAMIMIFAMLFIGIKSLFENSYDFEARENISGDNTKHILLFGPSPFKLAGSITLGYCSHTFVFSILKNNRVQEKNTRDLFYGYLLVGMTYLLCGILGYIGFSGKSFDPEFKDVSNFLIIFFSFYYVRIGLNSLALRISL